MSVAIDITVSSCHCIFVRTTLTLADDVYEAAMALAQGSGKTLSEVVSDLARRALRPQPPSRRQGDLPTFSVSRDAPIIPGQRASALLAAEGLDE